MAATCRIVGLILALTGVCVQFDPAALHHSDSTYVFSQERRASGSSSVDSLQTWTEYVLSHLPETTPKDLIRQKQIRNRFHRQGYPGVLTEVLRGDGLGALLSYVRMAFAVEFSMEHKFFWIFKPDPGSDIGAIPFPDDWNIPPDPWKREWWYKE